MNSRLGPVSELTGPRRFSGRAEPRLQPRREERVQIDPFLGLYSSPPLRSPLVGPPSFMFGAIPLPPRYHLIRVMHRLITQVCPYSSHVPHAH